MNNKDINTIVNSYINTRLWLSELDELTIEDIKGNSALDDLFRLKSAIRIFSDILRNRPSSYCLEQFGHDLCLEVGECGVGFEDRELGLYGEELAKLVPNIDCPLNCIVLDAIDDLYGDVG